MDREFKLMIKLANPYLECQTIEAGKKFRAEEVIKTKIKIKQNKNTERREK